MRRITIFDTTLRDGEQTPAVTLLPDEKLQIALALADLGVDVVEAGFPAAAPEECEAVARIAETLRGTAVCALSRPVAADVDAAVRAVERAERPRVHIFSSGSKIHIEKMLGKTLGQVVAEAAQAVAEARRYVDDVEFSPQDATRADPVFLDRLYAAVAAAGATVVNIPDTVGYAWPTEMAALVRRVRAAMPRGVGVSVHCHDDLGLAVANSLASIEAGADQVECTMNGIGERAGNAALEEIVTAMRVRTDALPFTCGVDDTRLSAVSDLVARLTGVAVQANKAVVGRNAFRHESGIHQDGVLKERQTYEIIDPASVGAASALVLGKHSGRHALRIELERMGIAVTEPELGSVWREAKHVAAGRGALTAEALAGMAARARAAAPATAEGIT